MLTLHFISYSEIEKLPSDKRIEKILDIAKEHIVLIEGRLKKTEESELIKKTMEQINNKFKGIELAVINPEHKDAQFFSKLKNKFANILLGDRIGFTVIGPATIIKEIKQDPNKIQLMLAENKKTQPPKGKK